MGGIAHPRTILEANLQLTTETERTGQLFGAPTSPQKGKAVDAFQAVAWFDNGCAVTFRPNRASTGHKAFFESSIDGNREGVQWELEGSGLPQVLLAHAP